jgi:hypothetical protein
MEKGEGSAQRSAPLLHPARSRPITAWVLEPLSTISVTIAIIIIIIIMVKKLSL